MNYFIMHDWLIVRVWFGLIRELSQRFIVEGEIGFGIVRIPVCLHSRDRSWSYALGMLH
jgi:hypothetical protein